MKKPININLKKGKPEEIEKKEDNLSKSNPNEEKRCYSNKEEEALLKKLNIIKGLKDDYIPFYYDRNLEIDNLKNSLKNEKNGKIFGLSVFFFLFTLIIFAIGVLNNSDEYIFKGTETYLLKYMAINSNDIKDSLRKKALNSIEKSVSQGEMVIKSQIELLANFKSVKNGKYKKRVEILTKIGNAYSFFLEKIKISTQGNTAFESDALEDAFKILPIILSFKPGQGEERVLKDLDYYFMEYKEIQKERELKYESLGI